MGYDEHACMLCTCAPGVLMCVPDVCARLSGSVYGCKSARACAGVRKCAQVCASVRRCAQVCAGVR